MIRLRVAGPDEAGRVECSGGGRCGRLLVWEFLSVTTAGNMFLGNSSWGGLVIGRVSGVA